MTDTTTIDHDVLTYLQRHGATTPEQMSNKFGHGLAAIEASLNRLLDSSRIGFAMKRGFYRARK